MPANPNGRFGIIRFRPDDCLEYNLEGNEKMSNFAAAF